MGTATVYWDKCGINGINGGINGINGGINGDKWDKWGQLPFIVLQINIFCFLWLTANGQWSDSSAKHFLGNLRTPYLFPYKLQIRQPDGKIESRRYDYQAESFRP
jgi:hypothetical protein